MWFWYTKIVLSNLIKTYLEKEAYQVTQFFHGRDTLEYLEQ